MWTLGYRLAIAMAAAGVIAPAALAEGLPKVEHTFGKGATLRFYGQVNKGVLQYDDGAETETYGLIDNDNSSTRAGISYRQEFGDGWTFENVNEFGYAPFSTANINILQQTPPEGAWEFSNANIRKLDFTVAKDGAGKFWIGQGSMATDGVQEIDLSGTDVVAYSSVADSASAQLLRLGNGDLSDTEIGDVFNNHDGPRRVRIRYDTPAVSGFTAAAAFGRNLLSDDADERDQNIVDGSLTYASTFGDFDTEAGIGYYWQDHDGAQWEGSASALHAPTGLNATFAFGDRDPDEGDGGRFWYGKLGLLRPDLINCGATAVSLDFYGGSDFALDSAAGVTSSESESWGLALVQTVERANSEIWLTYRSYDFSDNVTSYDDGQAVFGGVRFKF